MGDDMTLSITTNTIDSDLQKVDLTIFLVKDNDSDRSDKLEEKNNE